MKSVFDSFDRRIDYLRISVTDRCNLRCRYCMPEEGVCKKQHQEIISYELIERVVEAAVSLGITKIRLTGGEPLVRKGIVGLVEKLAAIEGLKELTMTSNGTLLSSFAQDLKRAGLDRVNVSLDTLDPERYRWLTRGGEIEAVLRGLESLKEAGFQHSKINMVLLPDFNSDEVEKMKAFCRQNGFELQRIHQYHLADYRSIDFSSEAERPTPCSQCNRIRLTADGMLKPCLFSDIEIPLDPGHIRESLLRAVAEKPAKGCANTSRENWQIGG